MVAEEKAERDTTGEPRLSPRQEECLRGVLELKSAKEIARDLGISPHAVEKHLRLSREKFGVATSAEAARLLALRKGIVSPHYGFSDLAQSRRPAQQGAVLGSSSTIDPSLLRPEDTNGALLSDRPLRPWQTLLAIAAVSFASIVGLLLLVACADAVRRLVSG